MVKGIINMKYIAHKRFKDNAICGLVNIPATTICECDNDVIKYNDLPICYVESRNAHQFFSINEDGMGMLRGKLTQSIQKALAKHDDNYQNRWNKIWGDDICQKYKRKEHADFWLWNHDFFNANIDELKYIANLIDAKVEL